MFSCFRFLRTNFRDSISEYSSLRGRNAAFYAISPEPCVWGTGPRRRKADIDEMIIIVENKEDDYL